VTKRPKPSVKSHLYPRLGRLACLLLVLSGCVSGCDRSAAEQREGSASAGFAIAALAGVPLRDQDGRLLEARRLAGKTVLLNFMFTSCPEVCPQQAQALARVRAALPEDVRARVWLLSISVDPETDSPERLKAFAAANAADLGGWSFVVATPEATNELSRRLAMFDQRGEAPVPAAHATGVYLFDSQGQMRQRYAGVPIDEQRLAREVPRLARLHDETDPT
jgi:protein SCO1